MYAIYNIIKIDPKKYRYVVDNIVNDNILIIYIPCNIRNSISKLYPEDIDLTIKLLIDTTSYYKTKRYDTGEYDEDGEPIERTHYYLINHCPEYYFLLHFYYYYGNNNTLKNILNEYNVKEEDIGYYKTSPELMKYYNDRQLCNSFKNISI
jgi:hypothetical protein